MKLSKLLLFLFIIFLVLPLSFAAVSYEQTGVLSNSATLLHDQSHQIEIKIQNDNWVCPVQCSTRMISDYINTRTVDFGLNTYESATVRFILDSPTKKESNYAQDGSVRYYVDIECTTVPSTFCASGYETINPITQDSKYFIINYGLSEVELRAKSEYESLVNLIQRDIENLYNRANELESLYNNLDGNIKISYIIQQNVYNLKELADEAFLGFEESQDKYEVLEMGQAVNILSRYKNINFNNVKTEITKTQNELIELQERHDTLVQELVKIKNKLSDNSEELQRAGLSEEYLSLVNKYENLETKLNNLQFDAYISLESEIRELNTNLDKLLVLKRVEEERIVIKLNNVHLTETAKFNNTSPLNFKSALTQTINQFCTEFETSIPQEFRTYNYEQQEKILQQNQKNREYNTRIEPMRNTWSELVQLTNDISKITENKVFDEKLIQGCDVNSLLEDDLQDQNINTHITACEKYKDELLESIQDNQKITSKFLNFFKHIFIQKPELNQTILPEFDALKRPTNLTHNPITFSTETINTLDEYCSFNPQIISLRSPTEVRDISYEESNTKINFANVQGNCEVLNCYNNRDTYPILFVHGHMFYATRDPMIESRYTFDDMIGYLSAQNKKAYDAGTIVDRGNEFLDSGLKTNPGVALFRTTYYGHAYIDQSGNFRFEKRNYESIGAYADKLESIIDSTLETTGRSQVKIVSHSMGGLVVREYLRKNGPSKVDTFIMIGTPNQGTEGIIDSGCALVGANTECSEMTKGSTFLSQLNKNKKLPSRTHIISGTYQASGTDGIVLKRNTEIEGVEQYNFESPKHFIPIYSRAYSVHSELVNPNMMPEVSDKISELLNLN